MGAAEEIRLVEGEDVIDDLRLELALAYDVRRGIRKLW
jgi:hypothetical protein